MDTRQSRGGVFPKGEVDYMVCMVGSEGGFLSIDRVESGQDI